MLLDKTAQNKLQRPLLHVGLNPFIDGGAEDKPPPIQILDPWKDGSHPENFGLSEKYDINRCFSMISIIMAPKSEETPVTSSKRQNRLTR